MQLGVTTTLTHLPDTPTIFIPEDVLSRPHDRLERVGKGAFGEVFKYTDEEKKNSIAVKCLPVHENALMEVRNILFSIHSRLPRDFIVICQYINHSGRYWMVLLLSWSVLVDISIFVQMVSYENREKIFMCPK